MSSRSNNTTKTNNHQEATTTVLLDDDVLMKEPIYILGAGSIGMLFAASIKFTFPNYPLKLLVRDKQKKSADDAAQQSSPIKQLSICLRQIFPSSEKSTSSSSSPRIVHVPCETPSCTNRPFAENAYVIVTTKAGSAVSALQSIEHRFDKDKPPRTVLFCNGNLAVAEELLFEQQQTNNNNLYINEKKVYLAVTTHGAYRELEEDDQEDNDAQKEEKDGFRTVVHAGNGNCVMEQQCSSLAHLWTMAGLNGTYVDKDQMQELLWNKLAANCVINPLTALHQCTNGELHTVVDRFDDYYYPTILEEVSKVYCATTHTTTTSSSSVATVQKSLREYVDSVLSDTANNKSSMLQDIIANRPTEVDYLSGYVVKAGQAHGIACPVNEQLWKAVKGLERR